MGIHKRHKDSDFTRRLIKRAGRRRDRDPYRRYRRFKVSSDYLAGADLCYAYDTQGGDYYVGYSNQGGGIMRVSELANLPRAQARLERLTDNVRGVEWDRGGPIRGRARANCAEAAALSVALSYGCSLGNLAFITFKAARWTVKHNFKTTTYTGSGSQPKDPCDNCMTWIRRAHAYYSATRGRWVYGT